MLSKCSLGTSCIFCTIFVVPIVQTLSLRSIPLSTVFSPLSSLSPLDDNGCLRLGLFSHDPKRFFRQATHPPCCQLGALSPFGRQGLFMLLSSFQVSLSSGVLPGAGLPAPLVSFLLAGFRPHWYNGMRVLVCLHRFAFCPFRFHRTERSELSGYINDPDRKFPLMFFRTAWLLPPFSVP